MIFSRQIQGFPTPFLWISRKAQTEFSEALTISAGEPVAEGELIWQDSTLTPSETMATFAGSPVISYEDANMYQAGREAMTTLSSVPVASGTLIWQNSTLTPTDSFGVLAGSPVASNALIWMNSALTPTESFGVLAGLPVATYTP